jgi:hypothetical protein
LYTPHFQGHISGLFFLDSLLDSSVHRVRTIAQAGEGGVARPPPFTIFTVTYKVAVYDPTKRADTLPVFHLYPYVLCASIQHGPLRTLQTHHLTILWQQNYNLMFLL